MIFLFSIPALILLTALSGAAAVTDWELSPENPVVGDTVEIMGSADPEEEIDVLVSFDREVQVSDGRYEYLLEDVKIPSGFNNRFTVQAKGADDLNVRVKMILWLTKSAQASAGTATVSQSRVPPGTYRIKIDGDASGSSVELKITALQQIKADSEGKFLYTYSTKSMPAGSFEVELGGYSEQVTLKPEEGTMLGPVPDSELIDEEVENTDENGTAGESGTPEESSSPEETLEEENIFEEELVQGSFQDENGTKVIGSGGEKDEHGGIYIMGGLMAGLMVLLLYSKLKKPKK